MAVALAAVLAAPRAEADPLVRGVDLSFLPQIEASGGVFRDGTRDLDLPAFLAGRGIDAVRLRLWHTPPDGTNGLDATLELAARVHRAGMDVLLDVHYADTWADPGHQTPPAAWRGLALPALADTVRTYTARVLDAFTARGIPVASIQIGNEITAGMLWPVGRVGDDTGPDGWNALATLLRAGIEGVREADADPSIVLHVDRGGDLDGARWFLDHLAPYDLDYDRIGLSFYPWWHGTLDDLDATVRGLVATHAKEIVVVETAYPWTLEWFDDTHNVVGLPEHVLPGFPATPAGQRDFVEALLGRLASVPEVVGVFWWAPEWVAAPGFGSSWENLTLFDREGRPLPALRVFGGP